MHTDFNRRRCQKPRAFGPVDLISVSGKSNASTCKFSLPRDTHTIAFSVSRGELKSRVALRNTEKYETGRVEIRIRKHKEPMFVVLSAYSPVVWDLDVENGASIAGILVMGVLSQGVAHVPDGTRVGFVTSDDGAGAYCPQTTLRVLPNGKDAFDWYLRKEFEQGIDEFHSADSATCMPNACRQKPTSWFWNWIVGSTDADTKGARSPAILTSYGERID